MNLLLLFGGLAFVFVVILLYWFKIAKPKRVDEEFNAFGGIVGPIGKSQGFKRAQTTGAPQLLVEMSEDSLLSSLLVQYGHEKKKMGMNSGILNVSGYHKKQDLKVEFFVRPRDKPSPVALRKGPSAQVGSEAFDTALTIDYANTKGLELLKKPAIQQSILGIDDLVFLEARSEGVRTLLWGERKGITSESFKKLYNTLLLLAKGMA